MGSLHMLPAMQVLGGPQQTLPHRFSPGGQQSSSLAAHMLLFGHVTTHTHLFLSLHILAGVPQGLGSVGQQLSMVSGMHLSPHFFSLVQQSPLGMQVLSLLQRRWPVQHMGFTTQVSPHLVSLVQQSPLGMQVLLLLQRRWPMQHMVFTTQVLSAHLVSLLQQSPLGMQLLVLLQRR